MPQIYWNIGYRIADYNTLISWWSDVVKDTNVKLYIGQAAYRAVGAEPNSVWYNGAEIEKQIELNRTNSYISGYCMFSYKSFLNNKMLYSAITNVNKTENTSHVDDEITPIKQDYQYYTKNYKKILVSTMIILLCIMIMKVRKKYFQEVILIILKMKSLVYHLKQENLEHCIINLYLMI